MKWETPKLFVLSSGEEAQANKNQWFAEAPAESCVTGVGCPGSEDSVIVGPS